MTISSSGLDFLTKGCIEERILKQTTHFVTFSHFFAFSCCLSLRCGRVFFSLRFASTAYFSPVHTTSTISIKSLYDRLNSFSDLLVTSLYSSFLPSSYSFTFFIVTSLREMSCVNLSSLFATSSKHGCCGTSSFPWLFLTLLYTSYAPKVGSR